MKMKKILSLFLTLAMMLVMMPMTAWAEDVSDWTALQQEISNASDGATITLSKDVTASAGDTQLVISGGKKLTIDLNGHTLDRGLSSDNPKNDGCVIYLKYDAYDAELTLTNGTITGGSNNTEDFANGGAIDMDWGCKLNMDTITMENNYSKGSGGAIHVDGNVNLKNCIFKNNSCNHYGGAIYVDFLSYLTMEDCVFTNNYTTLGYDTYAGAIHGAYTQKYTDGDYQGATIKLSGSLTINGDTLDEYNNNLFLGKNGIVVDVIGPLTNTDPIPVSVEDKPSGTGLRVITKGLSGNGTYENFVSENNSYEVVSTEAGEAAIARKGVYHKVTVDEDIENGSVTANKEFFSNNETVELTETPDKNCEFIGFTVTTASGGTVDVDSDNHFTMPDEDVTVTATFAKIWKFTDFTWTGSEADGYTKAVANYESSNDASVKETVDATISTKVVDPTCTKDGKTVYTATVAKDDSLDNAEHSESKDAKPTSKTGHKWGKWTKLNDKQHQRVCSNDSSHVEKADHKWNDDGTIYTCADCGATKEKIKGTLLAKMTAKGKRSLDLSWTEVKGADGYDIFFNKCGKQKIKKIKTIKGNKTFKWTAKGLKKKTAYKAVVKAWVMKDGKKTYVMASPMAHAYTSGGRKNYTNAKSVIVDKDSVSLDIGKTYNIEASVTKLRKGKKLMSKDHAPKLRYVSSNSKVATVSDSGKITAKGKGTCKVYVLAVNGASKAVSVTVK